MVKVQGKSDYDKLDDLVHDVAARHQLRVDVTGWTRKTYDVYRLRSGDAMERAIDILARIESFATTNGEITVFDDAGMAFATDLGTAIEQTFPVGEATIVRRSRSG